MTTALAAPPVGLIKERTALYRFFHEGGALLYVGITSKLGVRWQAHMGSSEWWPLAARVEAEWLATRALALRAELDAIRTELPIFNRAGAPPKPKVVQPPVVLRRAVSMVNPANERAVMLAKMVDHKIWLSTTEVGVPLGVSPGSVVRLIERGLIEYRFKCARRWRYCSPADVLKLLAEATQTQYGRTPEFR